MVRKEAMIILEIRMALQKKISARLSNELSQGNITIPQYNALLVLKESGSTTMSFLAKCLGVTMAAITPLIDKLSRLKLVQRERSRLDRRVVQARLTGEGSRIVAHIQKEIYNVVVKLLEKLDPEEVKTLVRIYQKIYREMRNEETGHE